MDCCFTQETTVTDKVAPAGLGVLITLLISTCERRFAAPAYDQSKQVKLAPWSIPRTRLSLTDGHGVLVYSSSEFRIDR
jgi:hypothetical protein